MRGLLTVARKPPAAPATPVFVGLPEAARRLGISLTNVHKKVKSGRIRGVPVEGSRFYVVSEADLIAYESTKRRPGRPRATPVLRFKEPYIAPILSGRKTQTMRARIPSTIAPGVTVNASCRYGEPPFAQLLITEIETMPIADLTDRDARADGFDNVADLRRAIATTYPAADELVVLRFKRL